MEFSTYLVFLLINAQGSVQASLFLLSPATTHVTHAARRGALALNRRAQEVERYVPFPVAYVRAKLISELACGDKDIDERTAAVISEVLELCCKSKMDSPSGAGRATFIEALELGDRKDWVFTIMKLDRNYHLEVKFSTDIQKARLRNKVAWVSENKAKFN